MARFTEHLENPLPGTDWYLRKLKFENHIGTDDWVWTVELMKRADGTPVRFSHADLYLTWVRAIEAAHMHETGIFKDPPAPQPEPAFVNPHSDGLG